MSLTTDMIAQFKFDDRNIIYFERESNAPWTLYLVTSPKWGPLTGPTRYFFESLHELLDMCTDHGIGIHDDDLYLITTLKTGQR